MMQRPHRQTLSKARARRLRKAIRTLVCVGVVLAVAAVHAVARPMPAYDPDGITGDQGSTVVRVLVPNTGFDWRDASIGAAAGLAISLVALGGAIAASRRRDQRVRTTIHPTA